VGRFQIEGEIARGGMGVVWRARDLDLGRTLAIKVLLEEGQGIPELVQRFRTEARITGQLQHPGIPPVHEVGVLPDGRPFFAMKLIQGHTLAELLRRRSSPADDLPRFLGIFEQVCQTLAYAHSQGVIHRDLKPSNVMVGAFGEVQVMDWGLAKVLRRQEEGENAAAATAAESGPAAFFAAPSPLSHKTTAGSVMGTLAYMAPEQARGESNQLDERCDVFGLGAILCALLTGEPPYRAAPREEMRSRAARGELGDALARLEASGAEGELVRLARHCLAAAKEDRPGHAGVVAEVLGAYLAGVQERLHEAERQRAAAEARAKAERQARRLWLGLAAAVLLLVLAGGGAAWLLQQQRAAARAHQAQTDREARAVLERARQLLDEGWRAHDLARLAEAKAEAARAVDIARSGAASAAVVQQAGVFQAEAATRLARARKNRVLLADLVDVSAPKETDAYASDEAGRMVTLAEPSADEQYAAAFRRWGLDVDGRTEAEVLARLRQEPEVVLQDLIAGLDSWILLRRRQQRRPREWRRLFRVADRLDPSAQRRELRALLGGRPSVRAEGVARVVGAGLPWPALWELAGGRAAQRLRELRGRVDPATEPVLTVVLLAQVCADLGDADGAERVLRRALAARPNQVVLLGALGKLLERQGPSRLDAAIECYRAARACNPRLGVALGLGLTRAGRGDEAESVLRDLVRRQPGSPETRLYLGNVLYQEKKPAEAVVAYREAIRLRPDYAEAYTNLGIALRARHRLGEAVAAYRKAIALAPDFVEAYNNLGNVLLDQHLLGAAVAADPRANGLDPDHLQGPPRLGSPRYARQKLAEAVAAYRQAIALRPNYAAAHYNLGNALQAQEKPDEALAAYRKAVEIEPDFAEPHYALGNALLARRKLGGAVRAYRRAISLKPAFAEAYANLGVTLAEQRKLDEAVAAFRQAIRLQPEVAETHANLGNALQLQGKLDEALPAYRRAVALRPDHAPAWNNLGTTLQAQQQFGAATAAYRKAIELRPDYAQAWINLSCVLLPQQKFDEVVTVSRKAIDLKPDSAEAHFNLGSALLAQQKRDEAEAALRQAIRLRPDFAQAYNSLGNALQTQQKLGEAVTAYRRAIRLQPNLAEAHVNLGGVLFQQAQFSQAVAELKQGHALLSARDPRREGVGQLLQRCQRQLVLEARLSAVLQGTDRPASAAEQIEFGRLCVLKELFVAAARLHRDAFAAEPRLAEAVPAGVRHVAACAALLASFGHGKDAAGLDGKGRAGWRRQALTWLRADLDWWRRALDRGNAQTRAVLGQWLQQLQANSDLAAVRARDALAKLPEAERKQWQQFWADVAALHRRALGGR
jgi:tetratricopeptide (TPR) repeat protein